jgi:uncharacterized protein YndB with AHSA1/START domain
VPDRIEREVILNVPRERVWAALTEPQHLSNWFGTAAEVDLRPGGTINFVWHAGDKIQSTNAGLIEIVERPHRFVFRWRSFPGFEAVPLTEGPVTRVEFILDEHPRGTRLRVIESGFAGVPPEVRRSQYERNTQGWEQELGDLVAYLSAPGEC